MQDPQIPLQLALYEALRDTTLSVGAQEAVAALQVAGLTVPVFTQGASGAQYVLLSQWTATPLALLPGCERWECTVLVDIVTSFAVSGQVNELPALQIGAELVRRLLGNRLPLTEGWQMSPISTTQANTLTDSTGETVDVHRYYRLRTTLEFHS